MPPERVEGHAALDQGPGSGRDRGERGRGRPLRIAPPPACPARDITVLIVLVGFVIAFLAQAG
jgi:hypothetical protein